MPPLGRLLAEDRKTLAWGGGDGDGKGFGFEAVSLTAIKGLIFSL